MKNYEYNVCFTEPNGRIFFDMSSMEAEDLTDAFQKLLVRKQIVLKDLKGFETVSISIKRNSTEVVLERMKQPLE
jgi:hypothetical protein